MSHFCLVHLSIRKRKEKKIEKKINIDLAILPSHDTYLKHQLVDQWLKYLLFYQGSYTLLFGCLVIQLLALSVIV